MPEIKITIQKTEMARVGSNTNITRIKGYIELNQHTTISIARTTYLMLGSQKYSDIATESPEKNKLYFSVLKDN